ncbi:MAG: hypothetical protein ACLFVT_09465 [Syntrophobacteria bacterium]
MAVEGEVVLVHVEDKPAFFARIESIDPDVKPDWYRVGLLILQVPLVQVVWILKQEYIQGASFTMGGKKVMMEPVVAPPRQPPPEGEPMSGRKDAGRRAARNKGKVISLFPDK